MLSIWSTVLFWSLGSAYHLWSPSQCSYPAPSGGRMPPRTGAEKSQVLSAISQKSPFNIQVFVSSGEWSSNCPPKCPSECLPRITHVPENGFSLMHPAASWSSLMAASLTPLCLLPGLRPVPCSAAGMGGNRFHDISGRKSHLWVRSLLKRIPHCVACKPRCHLFGSIEHRPAWRQQPRELTF